MKGLLHGFRHYADFSGRDSRSLYWSFIIGTHFVLILLALPAIVAFMLDLQELLTGFLMRSFFMDMDEMLSFANEYFMEYCAAFTIEHGVATWCLLSAGVWGCLSPSRPFPPPCAA